ncbi:hypothetical protein CEK26_011213 [Fusarium fujikuroi]|uniref:Uncharacterized protein n=1 Tax=Fusarium fujikuroi TaxID=5127 RepID=A0A5Q3EZX7_FUSFU|nr:Uncharacterized protein Y057_6925 [Fusarium fujikuroi]QGI67260.1 hypothetical protein CEK27_011231 [Fusarium fujikuroi]QGI84491.1 hypothetical protein CEK25_011220 [Fusarium fujikuroi]QGI98144.1 hypothetical protein CEK26_011213 [Fusarium fujikuroi]VTT62224.1 unnamed protein product [Fusarium fujikuroi]
MWYKIKDSRPRHGILGLWEKQQHRPTYVLLPHKAQDMAGWVSSRNSSGEEAMLLSEASVLIRIMMSGDPIMPVDVGSFETTLVSTQSHAFSLHSHPNNRYLGLQQPTKQARLSPPVGTHGSSDGRLPPVNKVFLSS